MAAITITGGLISLACLLLLCGLLNQVLRLAILIEVRLHLVTSVTAKTALKVVVLTLTADPTTIWKLEVLFLTTLACGVIVIDRDNACW